MNTNNNIKYFSNDENYIKNNMNNNNLNNKQNSNINSKNT